MIRNTALCYETGSCANTPEQGRDEYLAAVEQSLELVRSSLDLSRLCELCLDIRRYARVAVFGVLEAGCVALNLHTHLLMMGKLVFTKISVAEQLKFIRSVGADGLIVFFSETGTDYDYGLVDIRQLDGGVFDSLRAYFDRKKPGGSYADVYRDSRGNAYMDDTGCIPFVRAHGLGSLSDEVRLEPAILSDLSRLEREYARFSKKGIPVYVTHTCIDIDRVPAEERENAEPMGALFTERFSAMPGVAALGDIRDFLYHDPDFYDTVYHLLTEPAKRCTGIWVRELSSQLRRDGRWEAAP